MSKITFNKKGNTLLLTILILTAVLTSTLMAAGLVVQGIKLNRSQKWSTSAYFAAEAAAERIVWFDFKKLFEFDESSWGDAKDGYCLKFNYDMGDEPASCLGASPACVEPVLCTDSSAVSSLANSAGYKIIYEKDDADLKLMCIGIYSGSRRNIEIKIPDYY